jgi:carbon monoxide dehydrogenase subunit G
MNVTGSFTTATPVAGLRALASAPAVLEQVSTLREVRADGVGVVRAVFSPVIALGRIPLTTAITTVEETDGGAALHVVGRRGVQSVDVRLALEFVPADEGTTVRWEAEVVVRGNAASVGQRVARDIARRAIGQVLAEAAGVAGTTAAAVR